MNFQELEKLLATTDIIDPSYPLRGTYVWLPTGFKFKELVFDTIKEKIEKIGYKQYQFPRLVPGSALRKVTRSIANFEDKVFWLRKGEEPLDVFLNPTGECGIYSMFNRWIKSHADLPLKMFQIGSTFRPHKHPYSLLNSDEFTSLLEAHSAHETKEDAQYEFEKVIEVLKDVHDSLGIPYKMLTRPQWGNLPVSEKMVSFETYLPAKEVSFNVGVAYYQGQIYSKAFDIKFLTKDGKHEYTHQVTFGISERVLAAMLSLHVDEYGLEILPEFAPYQAVVIPVYTGENDHFVREYAEKIKEGLHGVRVIIDDSKKVLPRKKFPMWRRKGIPVRIGVSLEDVKNHTVRVYRRDKDEPETLPSIELEQKSLQYFKEIKSHIIGKSEKILNEKIKDASSYDDISRIVGQNGIARLEWCGTEECGRGIMEDFHGEILGVSMNEIPHKSCVRCQSKPNHIAYYAQRAYSP